MLEDDITLEEAQRHLKEMGIPIGEWSGEPEKEAQAFTIPTFERQARSLENLGRLLAQQIEKDKEEVAKMHIALKRLEHGGGK
jgi:hypothetical protein